MADHLQAVQVLEEQFKDWTKNTLKLYRSMTMLWENFGQYYQQVYCKAFPTTMPSDNPLSDMLCPWGLVNSR